MYLHADHPFLGTSPDRLVKIFNNGYCRVGLLEVKCRMKELPTTVEEHHLIQVVTQMGVTSGSPVRPSLQETDQFWVNVYYWKPSVLHGQCHIFTVKMDLLTTHSGGNRSSCLN